MSELSNFVGGHWIPGPGQLLERVNPAEVRSTVSSFRYASATELEQALASGDKARASWRARPAHDRATILRRAADLLEARTERIAATITAEQGKTIAVSRGEVGRAAALLRYSAHDADTPTGAMYASPRPGERIFTDRVPVGQVLAITPWNVPLALPSWKLGPALVHGNTVLWKPSDVTPGVAVELVSALSDAGLPAGVLNCLFLTPQLAEEALRDPRIAAATFTGSTAVGRHLVRVGAEHGKDVLAEMGGKNAAIVLADADQDWACEQIVDAAMGWSGARCTATSKVIVESAIFEEFSDRLAERVRALTVGDPMAGGTDVGPVATAAQLESITRRLSEGVAQGARVIAGGLQEPTPDGGLFLAPTIVSGLDRDNVLFVEEVFGPVIALVPAADAAEALELANDTEYGLSGSIFGRDLERLMTLMDGLDVGVVHINSQSTGADPHVPFGGFHSSGTPHKEMGEQARDFFTRLRTVYIRGGRP